MGLNFGNCFFLVKSFGQLFSGSRNARSSFQVSTKRITGCKN